MAAVGLAADWHQNEAAFAVVEREREYDPLTDPAYAAPIPPIDLSTPEPKLRDHLRSLLDQEASLFNRGVTCPIKEMPDSTCLACPVSAARDHSNPLGQLCRVGQEQERVLTVILAQSNGLTG